MASEDPRELVEKTVDSRVSLLEGFDRHTADSMAHDHALDITSGILTPANIELFGISAAVEVHPRGNSVTVPRLLHRRDEAIMKPTSFSYAQSLRAIGESLEVQAISRFELEK